MKNPHISTAKRIGTRLAFIGGVATIYRALLLDVSWIPLDIQLETESDQSMQVAQQVVRSARSVLDLEVQLW